MWTKRVPDLSLHGLLLQELTDAQRRCALPVIEASRSREGFNEVRTAMHLNAEFGRHIRQHPDTLTEFCYLLTVFGSPLAHARWGMAATGKPFGSALRHDRR